MIERLEVVLDRLRTLGFVVSSHPAADLGWYAATRLSRSISSRDSRAPSSDEWPGGGWPRAQSAAFLGAQVVGHPHATDMLEGSFRLFGHGPYPYPASGADFPVDPTVFWTPDRLSRLRAALDTVATDHVHLDWHRDVLSGHVWDADAPSTSIEIGSPAGADVKVPWEVSRCHMVPVLALSWRPEDGSTIPDRIEALILDFVVSNPPNFGVNWLSGLEVAIRAINWLVGIEFLSAKGHRFDPRWSEVVGTSLLEHGAFLEGHLSWVPRGRNNHYFGEILGLLTLGAFLPASRRTDAWLAYGIQELTREVDFQFLDDGGSFEGSTAYHGLASEMACLGATFALAAHRGGRALSDVGSFRPLGAPALRPHAWRRWSTVEPGSSELFRDAFWSRLARAARFLGCVENRRGEVPQIGDNDSGRVLKIGVPLATDGSSCGIRPGDERLLDYTDVRATLEALVAAEEPAGVGLSPMTWRHPARSVPAGRPQPAPSTAKDVGFSVSSGWVVEGREFLYTVSAEGLDTDLEVCYFDEFGLAIWKSERLFLAVRCPLEQFRHPRAGHTHADELSVELSIDEIPVMRDPGTGTYTSDPSIRNRFRSRSSHCTPLPEARMPPGLVGLFVGPEPAAVSVHDVSLSHFHASALLDGEEFSREVTISGHSLEIRDRGTTRWAPPEPYRWTLGFSPRYRAVVQCDGPFDTR